MGRGGDGRPVPAARGKRRGLREVYGGKRGGTTHVQHRYNPSTGLWSEGGKINGVNGCSGLADLVGNLGAPTARHQKYALNCQPRPADSVDRRPAWTQHAAERSDRETEMGENGEGKIAQTAQAIAAITEAVPVYQDAVQPAAKEVGKSLHVVGRAVNVALSPILGLVWGAEQIQKFIYERVGAKLEQVPPEDIQKPKPHIAVPVVDALRYTGEEVELSDMYANLLATSMDRRTAYRAHPSFVEIIKNMSPDEAKVMRLLSHQPSQPLVDIQAKLVEGKGVVAVSRYVTLLGAKAGCDYPNLIANYIDNLQRLGLVEVPDFGSLTDPAHYSEIENHPQVVTTIEEINRIKGRKGHIVKRRLGLTSLGQQFIRACIIDKDAQPRD